MKERAMNTSVVKYVAVLLLLTGAIGTVAAQQQQVQESRILSDKWYLSVGGSATEFTTQGAIGFGSVVGTFIRLEDDLDLESDRQHLRVNGIYAFNPRHQIDFTFGDTARDGVVTIDEEITIGDDGEEIVYQIGADIATEFDSTALKVFYKYSFINNGKTQAGVGLGLSVWDYGLDLEGQALVDDGTGGQVEEFRRVSESIVAPIPSFLLFIHHAFTPKLIFRTTAGFFDLDVGDIEGGLLETRLTLDYFFNKTIGLGGGFEGSDIDFTDTGGDPLFINVNQHSVILYLGFAF
jgi:hypothetical protein